MVVVAVVVVVALIFNKHTLAAHIALTFGQSNAGLYYTFEQIYERAPYTSVTNGTEHCSVCLVAVKLSIVE